MIIEITEFLENLANYYHLIWKQPNTFKINVFKSLYVRLLGFTPDQYTLYSLDKKSYKDYITAKERWYSRRTNGKYRLILDDKLLFNKYFEKDLKLSPILFTVQNNSVRNLKNENISIRSFKKIMYDNGGFFLRPLDGGGGTGIKKIEIKQDEILLNGTTILYVDLFNLICSMHNYVATPILKQRGFSNSVYPDTVNTIRVITGYDEKLSSVDVLFALHRFGTKDSSPVDNANSGGIFAKIDVEEGTLSAAKNYANKIYDNHPDTNVKITGEKIPHWNKLLHYVTSHAKIYSFIPYLAWDIVLDNEKFEIIEINASSSLTMLQMFGGLRREKLGRFLKNNNIIK